MSSKEGVYSSEKATNDGKSEEGGDRKSRNSGPYQTGNQNNNNSNRNFTPRQTKFKGECTEMKGSVYDNADCRQADLFTKTNKVLAGYVGRTFKYGGDTGIAIESLAIPDLDMPDDPPDDANRTIVKICEKEVDEFIKRRSAMRENIKTLYSLVWGQCSENMRSRVEASPGYRVIADSLDGIGLLRSI
jgi:hypothetical protein